MMQRAGCGIQADKELTPTLRGLACPTPAHSYNRRGLGAICQFLRSFLRFIRLFRMQKKGAGLREFFSNLINDQSGVTAIEYALIAALIAVAAIAAFTLVGTNLSSTFSYVASQL
jgi:pilus assembly protein Flp/PilA